MISILTNTQYSNNSARLPVQLARHHQLGAARAISALRAQRVLAHVRVPGTVQRHAGSHSGALGDLHGHDRARKPRRVVVNVQHVHAHAEQAQVLGGQCGYVQLHGAVGLLRTQSLPVDARGHADLTVLLAHREQRRARAVHGAEARRDGAWQTGERARRVLQQPPDHGAHALLLQDAVAHELSGRGRCGGTGQGHEHGAQHEHSGGGGDGDGHVGARARARARTGSR
uniref:Uncharacterized protein n=1 Tax=Astyanax mexicanus TaxID=7994 RepID=A0A8B9KTF3_ASTMX